MAVAFEWDPQKASQNQAKRRVAFEEASTVFVDPLARVIDDPRDSGGEVRFVIVGHSRKSRLLAVMFTADGFVTAATSRTFSRTEW